MPAAYLVVEGPHDVELVGRLLRPRGFRRVKGLSQLDPALRPLVPRKFPADDEDLLKRVPVPVFFSAAGDTVAVHSAAGEQRLIQTVEETLAAPGLRAVFSGIGLLLDADSRKAAPERFAAIAGPLAALGLPAPTAAGVVAAGPPRCGVYVLPDNQAAGTLEDLLLEAAALIYPGTLAGARAYIDGIAPGGELDAEDRAELGKPAGRNKATVSCIASVLKPGKAVQVSIQDNRWLQGPALALPRIAQVQRFVEEILGLAAPAAPAAP